MNPEVQDAIQVILALIFAIAAIRAHCYLYDARKELKEVKADNRTKEVHYEVLDRCYREIKEKNEKKADQIEKLKHELAWRKDDHDATSKVRDNCRDDLRLAKEKIAKLEALLKTAMEN